MGLSFDFWWDNLFLCVNLSKLKTPSRFREHFWRNESFYSVHRRFCIFEWVFVQIKHVQKFKDLLKNNSSYFTCQQLFFKETTGLAFEVYHQFTNLPLTFLFLFVTLHYGHHCWFRKELWIYVIVHLFVFTVDRLGKFRRFEGPAISWQENFANLAIEHLPNFCMLAKKKR